jgi:hypothetical protein
MEARWSQRGHLTWMSLAKAYSDPLGSLNRILRLFSLGCTGRA